MRVLLDTNIIIHRENKIITNESIGRLFYWLDNLKCTKLIHPYSIEEINKYNDAQVQKLYRVKLDAYEHLKTIAPQIPQFQSQLQTAPKTENDCIDNQLLYELYSGRVDILITEDRKMRNKATLLNLSSKVFSINSFIELQTTRHPELITYKMLSVEPQRFGNIDITNKFFNTFKLDYDGFEKWFAKKCDEEAYVCQDDLGNIQGFLYLKIEDEDEKYEDIEPRFISKKRLKVGTFKVEATGFRLGERFLKIIFDNAIQYKADEIYVTLFENRAELKALENLLKTWGFSHYGKKVSNVKSEIVLIKYMNHYNGALSPKSNFPNVNYDHNKFFLPILPEYHTRLLPDSKLNTESKLDFLDKTAEKYSLEKVYISLSFKRDMNPGDLVLIYRTGSNYGRKGYESVVSTVCVLSELHHSFNTKQDFFICCQNRTVFTDQELEKLWNQYSEKLLVVKFIAIESLIKRPVLKELWDNGIINGGSGPRPFDCISNVDFNKIIELSETKLYKGVN